MVFNQVLMMLFSITRQETTADLQPEFTACIQTLLDRYFPGDTLLFYDATDDYVSTPTSRLLLPHDDDISIDTLLTSTNNTVVAVHDINYTAPDRDEYDRFKPQSAIFILTENQAAEWANTDSLFLHIKETEYWNRQSRTLIIIRNYNETLDMSVLARNALAGDWRWNNAINVLVMIVRKKAFYFFYWMPYQQPDCRRITDRPINDIWENGHFKYNIDLFPTKLPNGLNGCEIRILTSPCVPYTYEGEGFEEELMILMENHFNFTRLYREIPNGENLWSTNHPDGTPAGAFSMLYTQKADLAYGCIMLTSERYAIAESLPCFFQDSLTWFVPTPSVKSHAGNIFEAFPSKYWIYIAITTLISICVVLLITKIEDFVLTREHPRSQIGVALGVFAMAISSPITVPSKTVLLRIFSFLFAIYSLHITTTYQASLYKLYKTHSYENIYKSIEEAIGNSLLVWLRPTQKNMYNQSDHMLWNKILKKDRYKYLPNDPFNAFDEVASKKTSTVLFIKSTMQMYIKYFFTNEDGPQITAIPEQFASYPVSIFLAPGHPLFRKMSDKMNDIVAAGLVEYWHNTQIDERGLHAHLLKTASLSLEFEHISGALMFWGYLSFIGVCTFILEIVIWLINGKNVSLPMRREERNMRRQLFLASLADNQYTTKSNFYRLKRFM